MEGKEDTVLEVSDLGVVIEDQVILEHLLKFNRRTAEPCCCEPFVYVTTMIAFSGR